jgi:hypothetical protein
LFPTIDVGRDYKPQQLDHRLRARCTKAIEQLGLKPHTVVETLRDTGNSLIDLGVIKPVIKAS